jgi:hypothetical protein
MRTDYHEKREARIERFKELASKNEQLSIQAFNQADKMASVIPFGQPILIGHHSEKRDRNYRSKIHGKMDQGVALSQKSSYYEDRAEAAESNNAISSDNPDALKLLEAKLAKLQQYQETMKAINKIIKNKKKADVEKVAEMEAMGVPAGRALQLMQPDWCGRIGFPDYKLTNNNGNMKRIKDRIAQLQKLEQMEEKEIEIGEVKILVSPEKNRVQIFFPGKPSEAVRTELKSSGFRWSPMEEAWQKNVSSYAEHQAKSIVEKYYSNQKTA